MSIVIKGMEMPISCGYCKFKYRTMEGDECMFDVAYTTYQSRPKDCPLVPVPPHGRLIDADALMQHEVFLPMDGGHMPIVYASYVRNATTIITASEEEGK